MGRIKAWWILYIIPFILPAAIAYTLFFKSPTVQSAGVLQVVLSAILVIFGCYLAFWISGNFIHSTFHIIGDDRQGRVVSLTNNTCCFLSVWLKNHKYAYLGDLAERFHQAHYSYRTLFIGTGRLKMTDYEIAHTIHFLLSSDNDYNLSQQTKKDIQESLLQLEGYKSSEVNCILKNISMPNNTHKLVGELCALTIGVCKLLFCRRNK